MRLFSEKVKPTLTNSPLNILQVENYEEIFFDVYEVEVNKTKYPVEKVSEHNGNPVVSVPVVIEGKKSFYPFILIKGKPEVLFNENNTMDKIVDNFQIIEETISQKVESVPPVVEIIEKPKKIEITDNKREILEQIEKAKLNAKKEVKKLKIQKQRELQAEHLKKEKLLEQTLHDARYDMVEEFVKISQKIKGELVDVNDSRFQEIQMTIDNKMMDLTVKLGESLVSNFEVAVEEFDSKLKEMVKEIYSSINPKIDDELKNIATEIVEKVDSIEKNLDTKLDDKADKSLLEGINREMDAIRDGNIELNNKLNKGVNKSLSRVGNVDKKVDELTIALAEDLDNKIFAAEQKITDYYTEKLKLLEEKTFDITEETRKYIVGLVQESRNNLIEEIRLIKNEKPIEYIVESKGKQHKITSDDLLKDVDKKITSKVDNEVTRLRKYIAVYSGGGSVAQQFADGGTMNGNLTVVGAISASQYLGLSIPSGNYLPLSGGTVTGNVNVVGELSAKRLSFDLADGLAAGPGQLTWNSAESTLNLGVNSEVTLQLGQETLVQVKADEDIKNGQVVFASGASGGGSGNISVSAYRANAAGPDEMYMLGVATQDLTHNEFGFITTFGKVRDVAVQFTRASDDPEYSLPYNQGWEIGTVLYISAVDRGRYTSVAPTAPNKSMPIVMVIAKSGNNRIFFVRSEHGYHLNELHDVNTSNVQNNDILTYNSLSGVWTNTKDIVVNTLSATRIDVLSANITVIDIKQYELSGFTVQGDATIQGNISANGEITSTQYNLLSTLGSVTSTKDVRVWSVGSKTLSVSAQDGSPLGLTFKPDGTIMYIVGAATDTVYAYTLSTPWDITTATVLNSKSITAYDTSAKDVQFSPDGVYMFILGDSGNKVGRYTLSTPWDVSSATVSVGQSLTLTTISGMGTVTGPEGIVFKPDGTKFFVVDGATDNIYEVSLSVAWDLTSGATLLNSFNTTAVTSENVVQGLAMNSDGTRLFLVGGLYDRVFEVSLVTPWSLSNVVAVGSTPFRLAEASPHAVYYNDIYNKCFAVGDVSDRVIEVIVDPRITIDGDSILLGDITANDIRANETVYSFYFKNELANSGFTINNQSSMYLDSGTPLRTNDDNLQIIRDTTTYSPLRISNDANIGFTATATATTAPDTYLSRNNTGTLQIGTSSLLANGSLYLQTLSATGVLSVGSKNVSPTNSLAGMLAEFYGTNSSISINSAGSGGSYIWMNAHNQVNSSLYKTGIASIGGSFGRSDLHFVLNSNADANNATISDSKMKIEYLTGNVGIGTTSPNQKLTVNGNISATGTVNGTNLVYTTTDQTIAGAKTFSDNIVGNGTANRLPNQTATTSDSIITRGLMDTSFTNPRIISLTEEFLGGGASTNGGIGELGWWTFAGGGGTGATVGSNSDPFPNVGIRVLTCGNATNAANTIYLSRIFSLQTSAPWEVCYICKLVQTTDCDLIVGFTEDNGAIGVGKFGGNSFGVRYSSAFDTKFTYFSKATNLDWAANDANNYSLSSTVTADTNYHKFRIRSLSAGVIEMSVDSDPWTTISMVKTYSMYIPYVYMATRTTTSKTVNVDYFSLYATTNR